MGQYNVFVLGIIAAGRKMQFKSQIYHMQLIKENVIYYIDEYGITLDTSYVYTAR